MNTLKLLNGLYIVLSAMGGFLIVYQAMVLLFGLLTKDKKRIVNTTEGKTNAFGIIISARNEENVIGTLIDSLKQQNYPKDKYNIFVIADNCTDNTKITALAHGATVYERRNLKNKGKGAALNWFFKALGKKANEYDAYVIFDADNIVDKNYLTAMNAHINKGEVIIQGNREIKNPHETWVSGSYAIYFWWVIRVFMTARQRMGLSGIVGGTGFAFSGKLIREGWHTQTITEDIEFSLQNIIKGNRVTVAKDALFYDEQPTTFRQSLRQRYRWTLGTLQCIKLYTLTLIRGLFSNNSNQRANSFDALAFIMSVPGAAIVAFNSCLGICIRMIGKAAWYTVILSELLSILGTFTLTFLLGAAVLLLCKKKLSDLNSGALFGWTLFLMSWMYINLAALFYRKNEWKPIPHSNTVTALELKTKAVHDRAA